MCTNVHYIHTLENLYVCKCVIHIHIWWSIRVQNVCYTYTFWVSIHVQVCNTHTRLGVDMCAHVQCTYTFWGSIRVQVSNTQTHLGSMCANV